MEGLIIGVVVLIVSAFFNRMLNVKEVEGTVITPNDNKKNSDYKSQFEEWSSSKNVSDNDLANQNPPLYSGLMETESNILEGGANSPYLEASVENYVFSGNSSNSDNEAEIAKQLTYNGVSNQRTNTNFNFDLQNAIIYTALLNPKFKEFE